MVEYIKRIIISGIAGLIIAELLWETDILPYEIKGNDYSPFELVYLVILCLLIYPYVIKVIRHMVYDYERFDVMVEYIGKRKCNYISIDEHSIKCETKDKEMQTIFEIEVDLRRNVKHELKQPIIDDMFKTIIKTYPKNFSSKGLFIENVLMSNELLLVRKQFNAQKKKKEREELIQEELRVNELIKDIPF